MPIAPVKKGLSIILVFILLLNTMGYYGVFLGLHYRNDRAMSEAIDRELYDPLHTVTFNVAVSIPYMPDQAGFEKVNGAFEHNGELYRMVKQRYAKDTLMVVCVMDTEHKKIDLALADYVKTFTDKAHKPASKLTINFLKDYLPIAIDMGSATNGWAARMMFNSTSRNFIASFVASIVHPPECAWQHAVLHHVISA